MIKLDELLLSWKSLEGINSNNFIDGWIEEKKKTIEVNIDKIPFSQCSGWMYDSKSGFIRRNNMSFFAISGIQRFRDKHLENQPIILQPEIGYLGIICKKINGILHFLMQAKIEPGNVNKVQISPTIQATKSNFTQKHGGDKPLYLDYFLFVNPKNVICDQIQSEQSSRFLGKRNRNMVIYVEDEVEVSPNHIWMTLGQIKRLMKIDNCVNMDTRTVISSIPFCLLEKDSISLEKSYSLFGCLNDYKMFNYVQPELVDIFSLKNWTFNDYELKSADAYFPFKIIFCNISIEGREVRKWCQPLFEATKPAFFGLFVSRNSNKLEVLVKAKPEIGCKEGIELGPTVQSDFREDEVDVLYLKFMDYVKEKKNIIVDVMLSEEGGRFYHESNRNVIVLVDKNDIKRLPEGYFWCDLFTLQTYMLVNNILNIQLRSMLSLLDYKTVFGDENV